MGKLVDVKRVECSKPSDGWGTAWPAPGKLNLMLRIVRQRTDGYHDLQTVFQFIDLCDEIRFYPRTDGLVRLRRLIPGVPESDDLTVRAACLLKTDSGCSLGVDIEVDKRLPMGGGLGGGSSDAATTLLVLNQLWDLGYSTEQLRVLGLRLGADVPIFLAGFSAWAEGVGEQLVPLELVEPWYVIAVPDCHVSTAEVFGAKDLTRDNIPVTMEKFASGWVGNDCMSIVLALYPAVDKVFRQFSVMAEACLTGTGGCLFAQFSDKRAAEKIADGLSGCCEAFVARGLNGSPLHRLCAQYFAAESLI